MPSMDDFKDFLATIRKQTGLEMLVPDEDGLVSFRVDDQYNVNLQFITATGKMLCFVEVCTLPADAGVAVYRDMMAGCLFGKETAGGYFALEPKGNTILYNYLFDFEAANAEPENFVETLENILQLVDIWAARIRSGGEESPGEAPDASSTTVEALQAQSVAFFRP